MLGALVEVAPPTVRSVEDAAHLIGTLRHCIRRAAEDAKSRDNALRALEDENKRAKATTEKDEEMLLSATDDTARDPSETGVEKIVKDLLAKVEAVTLGDCEAGNPEGGCSTEWQTKVASLKR